MHSKKVCYSVCRRDNLLKFSDFYLFLIIWSAPLTMVYPIWLKKTCPTYTENFFLLNFSKNLQIFFELKFLKGLLKLQLKKSVQFY